MAYHGPPNYYNQLQFGQSLTSGALGNYTLTTTDNTMYYTYDPKWQSIGSISFRNNIFLPPEDPIVFTKEKKYAVVQGNSISRAMTEEEAVADAEEKAHQTQGSVFIIQVDSVVKPKRETTRSTL